MNQSQVGKSSLREKSLQIRKKSRETAMAHAAKLKLNNNELKIWINLYFWFVRTSVYFYSQFQKLQIFHFVLNFHKRGLLNSAKKNSPLLIPQTSLYAVLSIMALKCINLLPFYAFLYIELNLDNS